jgi:hypothetical protein
MPLTADQATIAKRMRADEQTKKPRTMPGLLRYFFEEISTWPGSERRSS